MTPIFVDTAAWIALINVRDALHIQAQSVYANLVQRKVPLVTTEFVLLEVADGLSDPPLRRATIGFIDALRQEPTLEIVPLNQALRQKGWALSGLLCCVFWRVR